MVSGRQIGSERHRRDREFFAGYRTLQDNEPRFCARFPAKPDLSGTDLKSQRLNIRFDIPHPISCRHVGGTPRTAEYAVSVVIVMWEGRSSVITKVTTEAMVTTAKVDGWLHIVQKSGLGFLGKGIGLCVGKSLPTFDTLNDKNSYIYLHPSLCGLSCVLI